MGPVASTGPSLQTRSPVLVVQEWQRDRTSVSVESSILPRMNSTPHQSLSLQPRLASTLLKRACTSAGSSLPCKYSGGCVPCGGEQFSSNSPILVMGTVIGHSHAGKLRNHQVPCEPEWMDITKPSTTMVCPGAQLLSSFSAFSREQVLGPQVVAVRCRQGPCTVIPCRTNQLTNRRQCN